MGSGNMLYGVYIRIIFPNSLVTPSKKVWRKFDGDHDGVNQAALIRGLEIGFRV